MRAIPFMVALNRRASDDGYDGLKRLQEPAAEQRADRFSGIQERWEIQLVSIQNLWGLLWGACGRLFEANRHCRVLL